MSGPNCSRRRWTERELAWLREVYGLLPPSVISEVLERSIPSIVSMAAWEGIHAHQNRQRYVDKYRASLRGTA